MQSLEIAVFEAKDPEGFADRHARLHAQLGDLFKGYVTSVGLRSATEPGVYADVVLWADEASAHAAAAAMSEVEALAWFHPEIAVVRHFGHLPAPDHAAATMADVAAAQLVELAVVRPADLPAFVVAHTALHEEHLDGLAEIAAHLRLGPGADGVVGDLNGWSDPAAMETVAPMMAAKPELAAVFDEGNEMVVFEAFETDVMP